MLRPYQIEAAHHLAATHRTILFMPMGMGKTLTTLTAIENLSLTETVYPVLIVAPLRVAQSTWPDEVGKWAHLNHLTVSSITGKLKDRLQAVAKKADVYTVNFENLPWLQEHLDKKWFFKLVVADESTRLKGFRTRQGTKRAKALAKEAYRSKRFIGLTGTPAPNGLQDLWGQFWFVDRGERLGRTYTGFEERYFRPERVGDDPFAVRQVPLPHTQKEIEGKIADVSYSLDAKDHFDIADPIVNIIKVQLPAKVRGLYNQMEKEMFAELQSGTEVEAFNAAAKTNKCLQIASGFIYTDKQRNHEILHDEKLDALESVIEEAAGMPVLVAYNFKVDLDRLKKRFPKGRELDSNPKTIRDWNDGKIPVLFVHPKSAGHGLNLQYGSNILCFFGIDWNLEERLQVIERIGPVRQAQAGLDRPVFIHFLIAENTLDEVVLERVDAKRTVMETLMEALKK